VIKTFKAFHLWRCGSAGWRRNRWRHWYDWSHVDVETVSDTAKIVVIVTVERKVGVMSRRMKFC